VQSDEFTAGNADGDSHNHEQLVMNANIRNEQLIQKTMIVYMYTYRLCFDLPYDHDGA
jgi:hypothetical protein